MTPGDAPESPAARRTLREGRSTHGHFERMFREGGKVENEVKLNHRTALFQFEHHQFIETKAPCGGSRIVTVCVGIPGNCHLLNCGRSGMFHLSTAAGGADVQCLLYGLVRCSIIVLDQS